MTSHSSQRSTILTFMARKADPSACYALFGARLRDTYTGLREAGQTDAEAQKQTISLARRLMRAFAYSSSKLTADECFEKTAGEISIPATSETSTPSAQISDNDISTLNDTIQGNLQREYSLIVKQAHSPGAKLYRLVRAVYSRPLTATAGAAISLAVVLYGFLHVSESSLSVTYVTRNGDQYYVHIPVHSGQDAPESDQAPGVNRFADHDSLASDTTGEITTNDEKEKVESRAKSAPRRKKTSRKPRPTRPAKSVAAEASTKPRVSSKPAAPRKTRSQIPEPPKKITQSPKPAAPPAAANTPKTTPEPETSRPPNETSPAKPEQETSAAPSAARPGSNTSSSSASVSESASSLKPVTPAETEETAPPSSETQTDEPSNAMNRGQEESPDSPPETAQPASE